MTILASVQMTCDVEVVVNFTRSPMFLSLRLIHHLGTKKFCCLLLCLFCFFLLFFLLNSTNSPGVILLNISFLLASSFNSFSLSANLLSSFLFSKHLLCISDQSIPNGTLSDVLTTTVFPLSLAFHKAPNDIPVS